MAPEDAGVAVTPGVMVDFMTPKQLAEPYFWVCLWECFQKISTEPVNSVKQAALHSVGGHHPIPREPTQSRKAEEG